MKSKIKELIMPVIVLTLIAAVMAGLLGATDLLTKDRIAELSSVAEKAAVEKVIKAESYEKAELHYNGTAYTYFNAKSGEENVGYAFTLSQNGYGGMVTSVIGVDANGMVTAIEITDVSGETPGLGQNAGRASFTDQFKGKSAEITVVKSGADEEEVNAVTGATITSNAVTKSVNLALELFEQITKEGDAE